METTAARCPRPEPTIAAAVAAKLPIAILAAIVWGITASPSQAECNPTGRIDARCYSDLQNATAAAIAANVPLWLPAGTYVLNRELVIDYAPLATTGFQIISAIAASQPVIGDSSIQASLMWSRRPEFHSERIASASLRRCGGSAEAGLISEKCHETTRL